MDLREIKGLGFDCAVVAPSLIPKRRGDKVKRMGAMGALSLAKLLRADELTPVWVPAWVSCKATRDLTRARENGHAGSRTKREHVSAFLLRLGRPYPDSTKYLDQDAPDRMQPELIIRRTTPDAALQADDAGARQAQHRLALAGVGDRRRDSGMDACCWHRRRRCGTPIRRLPCRWPSSGHSSAVPELDGS